MDSRKVLGDDKVALVIGKMTKGCNLCFPGLKAVIFITGLCGDSCYYCPVSNDRFGKDVVYVNEEVVRSVKEIITEVERQGANGASITGGDPLVRFERTLRVIKCLKSTFGNSFHIHLYTSGRYATPDALVSLWKNGLDEIRFHPVDNRYKKAISYAVKLTGMDVGAEIPIAKGLEGWAKEVIKDVERLGGTFVNLNEMEFVESNANSLLSRGYDEDVKRPFTVKGSLKAAIKVLEWASKNASIDVHFCPASFKDSIQTRNRFRRLAVNDRRWYEKPTPYGTLKWAEVLDMGRLKISIDDIYKYKNHRIKIYESHPTRSRKPIVYEEEL
ncbi:MAG: radical SAM protein [Caldisphaeraceae archaeon]|nr:radical SAM protein [Caldisphaeraceae archaeon]